MPRKHTVACPFCYDRIDPRAIHRQCNGSHPAPGRKPCTKRPDRQRQDALGLLAEEQAMPTFPNSKRSDGTCPRCGGKALILACQTCHSALPPHFGDVPSPLFGIVGVRGSGKTVLLAVLCGELESIADKRFGAAVHTVIEKQKDETFNLLRSYYDEMNRNNGILPPATNPIIRGNDTPAVLAWRKNLGASVGFLSFNDASGEELLSQASMRERRYIGTTDGLILLLDPFGFPNFPGRSRFTNELTRPMDVLAPLVVILREEEQLSVKKKLRRPLAVVLTKLDSFWNDGDSTGTLRRPEPDAPGFDEYESIDFHHYLQGLIDDWGGGPVLTTLEQNFNTFRFFAVSALGTEPDYDSSTVQASQINSRRVAEPLLWLMFKHGVISKSRKRDSLVSR